MTTNHTMRLLTVCLVGFTLFLAIRNAAPFMLANLGMLAYVHSSTPHLMVEMTEHQYPVTKIGTKMPDAKAMTLLATAHALDPSTVTIGWGLGRVANASGDFQVAANSFLPVVDSAMQNPLLLADAVWALANAGFTTRVFQLAENFAQQPDPIRNTVLLALMELGTAEATEKLYQIDPSNLYANLRLLATPRASSSSDDTDSLRYFADNAIMPPDPRSWEYLAPVIAEIVRTGIWSRNEALRVFSVLVWRDSENDQVKRLLDDIAQQYREDIDWLLLEADLHGRRGEIDDAITIYEHILNLAPENIRALLGIATVKDISCHSGGEQCLAQFEDVLGWYWKYLAVVPDDPAVSQRVNELCSQTTPSEKSSPFCTRVTTPGTTDEQVRTYVADWLKVLDERIELLPIPIENSDFSIWKNDLRPLDWELIEKESEGWNSASFAVGADLFSPLGQSARITALWEKPEGKSPAYSSYVYCAAVDTPHSTAPILASFYYRTQSYEADAGQPHPVGAIQIQHGSQQLAKVSLEATGDAWRLEMVPITAFDPENGDELCIHLRGYAGGTIEFDELSIVQVSITAGP